MGEAKLRKARQLRSIDMKTGETKEARDGGSLDHYFEQLYNIGQDRTALQTPCKGCTQCCYHVKIEVDPVRERPEDLPYLLTEVKDGELQLQHRADGACIHLGNKGCTIYEHRPVACRNYDCRVFSLFGTGESFPGDHHTPTWIFSTRTREGALRQQACQLAGMLVMAEWKGRKWSAKDLINVAGTKVPKLMEGLLELDRLLGHYSKEELAKAFGMTFPLTEEAYLEATKDMARSLGIIE